jgi:hypothetical protein
MSVTKPVLIMSAYVARTSRLQLFSTDGGIDTGGTKATAVIADHPVFNGITLTAGVTEDLTTGALGTPDTAGVGNGTLIATNGTNAVLAEWNANTAFYTGSSSALGKRMYMAPSSSGAYAFNDMGTKLFLNVIQYIGQ